MSDDLIKTLDAAAQTMLAKALESENLADAQETFKIVAAWTERRHKLQPAPVSKGGDQFNKLRRELHEPASGTTKRSRASAKEPAADDDATASRPDA